MKIPPIYKLATWRNTTNIDSETGNIGIGFNLADGDIVRMQLDVKSVRHLVESINYYQFDNGSGSRCKSLKELQKEHLYYKAKIELSKAQQYKDPLRREYLLAKSNLTFLRLKEFEDHHNSSLLPGKEAS